MSIVFAWVINRDDSIAELEREALRYSHVSPAWIKIQPDGTIQCTTDDRISAIARQHNLPMLPLVGNAGFTAEGAASLLLDPAVRQQLAWELTHLVFDMGWRGITMDFEGPWAYRSEYTDFIRLLCGSLQPLGHEVALAVTAQTKPPTGTVTTATWQDPFDYPALGQLVDLFIIMGYDYHGVATNPGPVGPEWWLHQVLQYTLTHVPREKVVLGLPLYGYRWRQKAPDQWQGEYVTYEVAERWRAEAGVPLMWDYDANSVFYSYTSDGGVLSIVHYDNAESIGHRLRLIGQYDIAGVAFWCLGLGDPDVWQELIFL